MRQRLVAFARTQDRVGFTAAFSLLAPLILAFAFRRNPAWRDSWIPQAF
jgi:hypothetical protein